MDLSERVIARALSLTVLCGLLSSGFASAAGVQVTTQAASEGVYGLQIDLGPDCASAQTLDLDGDDVPLDGTYEACRTITATSLSMTTGTAILRAGDEVWFGESFSVGGSAAFTVEIDGALSGGPTYVQDPSPIDENVYTARFSAKFEDVLLDPSEQIEELVAYSGDWDPIFRVIVEPDGGSGFQLVLEAVQDGGGMVQTPPGQEIAVAAGWNIVELEWSAGPGDGQLRLSINGGPLQGLTDLDNDAARIESVRLGAVGGAIFDASGSLQVDSYSSTR